MHLRGTLITMGLTHRVVNNVVLVVRNGYAIYEHLAACWVVEVFQQGNA